jgi:type IV secretion system protein TrbG
MMSGLKKILPYVHLLALSLAAGKFEPLKAQEMTEAEAKAIGQSGVWQRGQGVVTAGAEGKVVFLFGESQPSVICAPLQVCDIELEAQETVRDVLLGDSVRWSVEAASSGEGRGQTIHLIVRPTEPGLQTSMIVTTSKRSYHIRLRSHETRYMARVGFAYPNPPSADLATVNARLIGFSEPQSAARSTSSYRITGAARWRPKRVYSDGQKTYIQFPGTIAGQDMPVPFVLSEGQRQIVNYRVIKDMMIIDQDVERAILVTGVGWRQKKITIKRGG